MVAGRLRAAEGAVRKGLSGIERSVPEFETVRDGAEGAAIFAAGADVAAEAEVEVDVDDVDDVDVGGAGA